MSVSNPFEHIFLAHQLTLFEPGGGGADYAHHITTVQRLYRNECKVVIKVFVSLVSFT